MTHKVNYQTVCEKLPDENLGYLPGEAEEGLCADATKSEKYENI